MADDALRALAENPDAVLDLPEGARRLGDERFSLVMGLEGRWASVSRLRLGDAAPRCEPRWVLQS